jgi:Family of unknown function (DUF5335)
METREIPKESWIEFFDGFSKSHQGWVARVEVLGPLGAQVEAEQRPLEGISADQDGKDIAITLGPPEAPVEHFVTKPTHVRIEQDAGAAAVQIESSEGDTTIVSLRPESPPEAAK